MSNLSPALSPLASTSSATLQAKKINQPGLPTSDLSLPQYFLSRTNCKQMEEVDKTKGSIASLTTLENFCTWPDTVGFHLVTSSSDLDWGCEIILGPYTQDPTPVTCIASQLPQRWKPCTVHPICHGSGSRPLWSVPLIRRKVHSSRTHTLSACFILSNFTFPGASQDIIWVQICTISFKSLKQDPSGISYSLATNPGPLNMCGILCVP